MITPQDIREKVFDRAVRGYDMETVDEFLDEIAADYTTLVKENNSLKSKMRVLVEKIEEYRQTEDSMRLALLSAQKMGAQIESDAQEKADKLVKDAQFKADNINKELEAASANERAKLAEAQKATQKYVEHMTAVCQKQIEFYSKLAEATLVKTPSVQEEPEEEEEEEATVRSIEDSVVREVLREPEEDIRIDELVDDELAEEEEPTRMFSTEPSTRRRKRSRAEYTFEDDDE